jgi:DNA adenine methylase
MDAVSPIGLLYSKLHTIYESAEFRTFEKANKSRRGEMFRQGRVGADGVAALRYARSLLGRKCSILLTDIEYLRAKPLNPLLKWRGGKTGDLRYLRANLADLFPRRIRNYYEPFLGGGAVWLAMKSKVNMFVNDICDDLVSFYSYIKDQNSSFFEYIEHMGRAWQLLATVAKRVYKTAYRNEFGSFNKYADEISSLSFGKEDCLPVIVKILNRKVARCNSLDERNKVQPDDAGKQANIEGALKNGYYTYIRDTFNSSISERERCPLRSACFYFLRDYSFSAMFRYNSQGLFNVPYGGVSYNKRSPAARLDYWKSVSLREHLSDTSFHTADFEEFLDKHSPCDDDFMFVDPPYDSDFSTYDKNEFGKTEQRRLANYLIRGTNAQFLAVMKNTEFVFSLYQGHESDGIRYAFFDKSYQVNIRNRNDNQVEHIVVYRVKDL